MGHQPMSYFIPCLQCSPTTTRSGAAVFTEQPRTVPACPVHPPRQPGADTDGWNIFLHTSHLKENATTDWEKRFLDAVYTDV